MTSFPSTAIPVRAVLLAAATFCLFPRVVQADLEGLVRTADAGIGLEVNGTFQPRFSFGHGEGVEGEASADRLGFGIRRARLMFTADFRNRAGVHYDVDLRGGSLASVDLYAFYVPSDRWRVRLGYVPGAQPRGYVGTSHTRVDGIDRAAIAERWADITIGGRGRDFGVDLRYRAGGASAEIFLHRGDGDFSASRGNFRQSISDVDATRGVDDATLAISGRATAVPWGGDALEIGVFGSYNAARGPFTAVEDGGPGRSYGSWSAHAYLGPHPGDRDHRLKVEVLGIHYESGALADGTPVEARAPLGWAVFGAAAWIPDGEVFVRYEEFDADDGRGADTYWTLGTSHSRSAARGEDYRRERITLAYTNALPGSTARADQHLAVLQWQWVY